VTDAPVLALERIAKRFGETRALTDASFALARGTVHALLGENGAGKTTLMRIAFGMLAPDDGVVRIDGTPTTMRSPLDAIGRGVGMVHQHFTIIPAMTVAENVSLGGRGRYRPRAAAAEVERVGRETGLVLDPAARAGDLPVSAQQRLEILKALAGGARILILDEPTAVLAPREAADLLALLRRFAAAGGAVVLITHKLREALGFADAITVLRGGRTTWSGAPSDTDAASLARATVGDLDLGARRSPPRPGEAVIRAEAVRLADERGVERLRGVSLSVHGGELLGVAGVEGAGQHELLRVLAGRATPDAGSVTRPADIAFIPEDRQRDAIVPAFTLAENIALRGAGRARGRMPWRAVRERASSLLERFDVRPRAVDAPASALSGGNQQRLVLARELGGAPAAVVAENPTRGLDMAATAATHRLLLEMRDRGAAVVVHSSDLDELVSLADRVIVMHAGEAREVPPRAEAIGIALLGGSA